MSDCKPRDLRAEVVEIYQIYITYIRHENDLIHQRAARFLGIQAALFAVVGLVLQKYLEIAVLHAEQVLAGPVAPVYLFLAGLSGVGMLSCRSALKSLSAADKAQSQLDADYSSLEHGNIKKEAKLIGLPDLRGGGNPMLSADGSKFLLWLPNGMIVFWFFVFGAAMVAFGYAFNQTVIWSKAVESSSDRLGIALFSVGSSLIATITVTALFLRHENNRQALLPEPTR